MSTIWDAPFEENPTQTFVDPSSLIPKEPTPEAETPESPVAQELVPPTLDLMGLIEVGRLTEDVTVYGHHILLHTLTIGEELEIALLTQKYQETTQSDQLKAFFTASVAAAIITVNGLPLITALGPHEDLLAIKYNYILKNWHWHVVEAVYREYLELQKRAEVALAELKKN